MNKFAILPLLLSAGILGSEPLDPKFFASAAFQDQFPGAFVLQEETLPFVEASSSKTFSDGDALIASIEGTPGLATAIRRFPDLGKPQRLEVIKEIFELVVQSSGLTAPEFVLDNTARRSAFFDFDLSRRGAGRVILNPELLFADSNPYAALLFLIHETRHSYQFQLAFGSNEQAQPPIPAAFRAGFFAQRRIFDEKMRLSFCDFLSLNQEYEAFLFGNYVMETLTQGAVDTSDMGTLASQYVPGQGLRIDLLELAQEVGPTKLLDAFNELEKEQYQKALF